MLRLPATQIDLGHRDLRWHTTRHFERLAHYEKPASKVKAPRVHAGIQSPVSPRFLNLPLFPTTVAPTLDIDGIISPEPVPRDSQSYWESVRANSETQREASLNLEHLLDKSHQSHVQATQRAVSSQENLHMLEDPEDGHSEDLQEHSTDDSPTRGLSDQSYEAGERAQVDPEQCPSSSSHALQGVLDNEVMAEHNQEAPNLPEASEGDKPVAEPRHHRSFFRIRRRRPRDNPEDASQDRSDVSHYLNVDGPADIITNNGIYRARSPDNNFDIPIRGSHDIPDHQRTSPVSSYAQADYEETPRTRLESSLVNEPDDFSDSPPFLLYRSFDRLRAGSTVLPRSPLYISQAAVSSSPERQAVPQSVSSQGSSVEVDQLPLPPHRSERLVHRSQSRSSTCTNPYRSVDHPCGSWGDPARVQDEHEIYTAYRKTVEAQKQKAHRERWEMNASLIDTSSPTAPAYTTASLPRPTTLRRRQHFPTQRRTSYVLPPHLQLQPTRFPVQLPFSARTRRIVSNAYLHSPAPNHPFAHIRHLPISNSATTNNLHQPFTPPPVITGHLDTRPPTRNPSFHSHTKSSTPHHHQSLRIYNDRLPTFSQPRTSVDLPENGHGPSLTLGYMTLPAGRSRRLSRVRGTGGDEETPLRRLFAGRRPRQEQAEQENVGSEGERYWLERERQGREREMDMEGGRGATMDRTPPRVLDLRLDVNVGRRISSQG
ncbi:hypothetical protein MMC14_007821 [Varicellaria rhodocarpa]|nr:hypothetical protein [Varicellaria rhodocarpa]